MNYNETLGRLIGVAHHMMLKKLDFELQKASIPLTAEQFKMMSRLWQEEGISQQELADKIGRNRAATGRMIDTLYNKGLLNREASATDKRLNLIFLTKKGKSIEKGAYDAAGKVVDISIESLTEKEVKQTKKILKNIIKNLR